QAGDHAACQGALAGEQGAAGGGLVPAMRAANVERLAGDHREVVAAGVHHGVGVVDPGHGLGVGVNVGGRDVGVRADQVAEVGDVAARDLAQVALADLLGVAADAALGPAEGDVDDGTFPRHPGGQGADLVEGDVGVVTDAALAWATDLVVQHAV